MRYLLRRGGAADPGTFLQHTGSADTCPAVPRARHRYLNSQEAADCGTKDGYRYFSSCQRTKFSSGLHQLVPDLTAHQGKKARPPNYFASHLVSQPPLSDRPLLGFFFFGPFCFLSSSSLPTRKARFFSCLSLSLRENRPLLLSFLFLPGRIIFLLTWAPHLRPECGCIEILSKRQR